jgi:hypothetical protein
MLRLCVSKVFCRDIHPLSAFYYRSQVMDIPFFYKPIKTQRQVDETVENISIRIMNKQSNQWRSQITDEMVVHV